MKIAAAFVCYVCAFPFLMFVPTSSAVLTVKRYSMRIMSPFEKSSLKAVCLIKVVAFLAMVLVTVSGVAQSPPTENGRKPFGSYDGSHLDSVNLMNGNVMLHLPLTPDYPQRGSLAQHYSLYVSSKDWHVSCVPDTNVPSGQDCFWTSGGTGITPQMSMGLSVQRIVNKNASGTGQILKQAAAYQIMASDGSSHQMVALSSPQVGGDATLFESADTTGLHLALSGSDSYSIPNSFTITDRHGNLFTGEFQDTGSVTCGVMGTIYIASPSQWEPIFDDAPLGDQYCTVSTMARQVTDGNGNQYLFNGPYLVSGAWVTSNGSDTMARQAPLTSGATVTDYSDCVSPLPILSAVVNHYSAPDGTTRGIKFCYSQYTLQTAFSQTGVYQAQQNTDPHAHVQIKLVTAILPDGTRWTFNYDGYGEVIYVGLPTGGSISYTWTEISHLNCAAGDQTAVSRAVATRTLNDGQGHNSVWTYSYGPTTGNPIVNVVTDPLQNDVVHTFTRLDASVNGGFGCKIYETRTQHYDGSQSANRLLRQVDTTFGSTQVTVDDDGSGAPGLALGNILPTDIQTTIYPSGLVNKVHKDYDTGLGTGLPIFGNVTRELIYDWGKGTPGSLLRETDTTYQWQKDTSGAYLTAHMLDLPASVTLKDGSGCTLAVTEYAYDESAYLTASGITTQHGTPPASVRGNPTSVTRWLAPSGSCNPKGVGTAVTSHTNWYDTGEVYQQADPLGHTTTHSYDTAYAGAYSTMTCDPLGYCVSGTYNANSGVLTSLTNENAVAQASGNTPGDAAHTSNYTTDFMGRLTSIQAPPDPSNSNQGATTSFTFSTPNAFPLSVQQQETVTTALSDSATSFFDGVGRAYKTQHVTPDGLVTVDTTFDADGRVASTSNPYLSTSDPIYGITQPTYDALDRTTQVTKQDGGVSTVDYSGGNCTVSTDEAGKQRRSCSDALGRLTEVDEQNPGAAASSGNGTVTINGNEQPAAQSGAPGTAVITVAGAEGAVFGCTTFCRTSWDSGIVSITVASYPPVQVSFSQTTNTKANVLAWALSCAVHQSSLPVDAPCPAQAGSGTTVQLTARTKGAATNYSISASATSRLNLPSYTISAPATMTGGLDTTSNADAGTVTITVNGAGYSTTYNGADSGSTIATRLASTITAGSWANATATGNTVTVTAKAAGPATNYTLSAGYSYNSVNYVNPSFTTSASGGTLTGGYNASDLNNNPYVTLYSYDALGNLLCIEQHGAVTGTGCAAPASSDSSSPWRVRRFTYDSLSRLVSATNPESGQISFVYDNDGNVLQKTSPAPNQTGAATQTISYCYDGLHRVTGKAYSAQTCSNGQLPAGTAVVSYAYDLAPNAKGHLVSLTDQAGTATYSYDILGRLSTETRTINSVSKTVSYDYQLGGGLKALHYPSGAIVTYTPDAAGRTLSAVDSANSINYITGATYGPDGALTGFLSGNNGGYDGITSTFTYNKRLQPVGMQAIAAGPTHIAQTVKVFDISYDFHYGSGDNGNVFGITNNKDATRNQTFSYDVLNRLISAQNAGTDCTQPTVNGKTKFWGNTYTYDAWGNLLAKAVTNCTSENMSFSANLRNQLTTGTTPDFVHDAAGNVTVDNLGHTYTYDQENRITGAAGFTYIYDADGNRVEKANSTTGTLYWYMTPGIVAESDLSGNLQSEYVFFSGERVARKDLPGGAVAYYFSDHLKTASVITSSTGGITAESDYYPWGGELQFVNSDSNHYKFTGKERDGTSQTETGLDYFGARYYSNWLGRFISADWSATPVPVPYANFGDPQSLNLYTYVRNIPTTVFDMDGHDGFLDAAQKWWDELIRPVNNAGSKGAAPPLDDSDPNPVTGVTTHEIVQNASQKMDQVIQIQNEVVAAADPTGQAAALNSKLHGDTIGVSMSVAGPLVECARIGSTTETVVHHIATNKNIKGGFTAALTEIFAKADMTLEHEANKMPISTEFHSGPHPPAYHQMVLNKTRDAVAGKSGVAAQNALIRTLNQIREFIQIHPEILRFP